MSIRIAANIRQYKPETTAVVGLLSDPGTGDLLFAMGASVPQALDAGYAKGCLFIHTNAADLASPMYVNTGTAKDCAFTRMTIDGA